MNLSSAPSSFASTEESRQLLDRSGFSNLNSTIIEFSDYEIDFQSQDITDEAEMFNLLRYYHVALLVVYHVLILVSALINQTTIRQRDHESTMRNSSGN